MSERKGIGAIAVIVVVVLMLAAAAGAYVVLGTNALGGAFTTSSTVVDGGGGPNPTSTTRPTSTFSLPTSYTSTSSTNTSMFETFRVHFNWNGQTNAGNTTDTQTGSGTFLITIDLSTGTGVANGTGHVELDETGLCTATNSTDYTFMVSGSLDPVSGNLTLSGGNQNPSEFTATRTCQKPYSFPPDILSWPAFYPSGVTLPARYGASAEGTISGYLNYEITLA